MNGEAIARRPMTILAQVERLVANLSALGARRLALLAAIGLTAFGATGLAGYYLSRPAAETLYTGLSRDDVANIGGALREAGIQFDVSSDGTTVYVPIGQTANVRMILAEKGLPRSGNIGNELYDKLGSLGLTSFMQEVTRVRAIEGELARTMHMIRGVKAARVHVVVGDAGSFRREKQSPSASVVLRLETADEARVARTVRHLVASAIPGMTAAAVTVLSSDGAMLAATPGKEDSDGGDLLSLETALSKRLQDSARTALEPFLAARNFRVSASARLNIDKKQVNEIVFNPESRVERSVRVVKESQTSQNTTNQSAAGVQSNIPQTKSANGDQKQANDETQKREELTNYELSSKTTATTTAGYEIAKLSIAVVVNQSALSNASTEKLSQAALDKHIAEISELVASATGINKERGDMVKVSVVDFIGEEKEPGTAQTSFAAQLAGKYLGHVISAFAMLGVALLVTWFGLRPAARALTTAVATSVPAQMALPGPPEPPAKKEAGNLVSHEGADAGGGSRLLVKGGWKSQVVGIEERVDNDETQAASVLKQWLRKDGST